MKARVLLVDDEPNVTNALKRALKDEDYEIERVTSAGEALKLMSSNPVDVLVTDEMMGNMSGSEFLKYVKQEHPWTASILLTGKPTLEAAVRAVNDGGVFKILEKPIIPIDFILILREALTYSKILKAGIEANAAEEPAVVLVADEDATARGTLKTMLEAEGYSVREACDEPEVRFQSQTKGIDCVVLNLKLEGQKGLDLLHDLAQAQGGIPVVLVSAPGRIYRESATEIHPKLTYLQEPVELKGVVQEVLARLEPAARSAAS